MHLVLKRRLLLFAVIAGVCCPAHAQPYWAPAGMPWRVNILGQVYATENHDTIYYAGAFQLDSGAYWQFRNPVMRYTQGQWDTLGYFNGFYVLSVVSYHDTLIACGAFHETIDGEPCEGIAYWANGGWHAYGEIQGSLQKLRVLDDTLYLVGGFDMADGQQANGIARREGGQWVPVGELPSDEMGWLDVIKYQGRLITIGNGYINGLRGIFQLIGNEWSVLGPGFAGSVSGAQCLHVYQGDLYVGGQISIPEGNAGQEIMRWDGNAFYAVGTGLQRQLGNLSTFSTCTDMTVHDGLLWVGGGFNYAGGVEAHGVATWNGSQWCGVPGDFTSSWQGGVYHMDFYYDTLFVMCGDTVDGQYVNNGAKFIGSSYVDTCGAPVGMFDVVPVEARLHVWQSAANELSISGLPLGVQRIELFDGAGRIVLQRSISGVGRVPVNLQLPPLASGLYSLKSGTATARCVVAGP